MFHQHDTLEWLVYEALVRHDFQQSQGYSSFQDLATRMTGNISMYFAYLLDLNHMIKVMEYLNNEFWKQT